MDNIQDKFVEHVGKLGFTLSSVQLDQFHSYYHLLTQWNEKMNLTAITDKNGVYVKHFLDSIMLTDDFSFSSCERIADIGSGAGFPGIPLKILFPHVRLTIVDALNKRITFLDELVERLALQDVECVHGRAEDVAREAAYRAQFDLVTARAVAKLNTLVEICLPFVKPGGSFCSLKGTDPDGEIEEASKSLSSLHGVVYKKSKFELPEDGAERHLVWIRKEGHTPKKYPRKAGMPFKKPLV